MGSASSHRCMRSSASWGLVLARLLESRLGLCKYSKSQPQVRQRDTPIPVEVHKMRDERLVRFVERKVAQATHECIHFLEVQPPMCIFQDLHDIGEVVVVAQLVAAELLEDVSRLNGLAMAGEVCDGLREVVLWQVFQAGDSLGQPQLP